MTNEAKILQLILWGSELTPKLLTIIESNMEYGVKFNFLSDLQKRIEAEGCSNLTKVFNDAVEAAKIENNEQGCSETFWYIE